ncbi:hypothetical protein JEG42_15310, partial [Anoxybacillus sp. LAT_11]|nr:hypothetical protein [Anoxybacillus sp. LAT_11]
QNDLPEIDTKQTELIIPNEVIKYWKDYQTKSKGIKTKNFHFDENERILLLLLYTFIRKESISNAHYQFLLNVSKNTVTTDHKRAILEYLFTQHNYQNKFDTYEKKLKEMEQAFNITFIEERMFDFIYLL